VKVGRQYVTWVWVEILAPVRATTIGLLLTMLESWVGVPGIGSLPAEIPASRPSMAGLMRCRHHHAYQPGRTAPARLASRSASIASKVIQMGRSPLSHAHSAAASPP
jgi:hypothetical protein